VCLCLCACVYFFQFLYKCWLSRLLNNLMNIILNIITDIISICALNAFYPLIIINIIIDSVATMFLPVVYFLLCEYEITRWLFLRLSGYRCNYRTVEIVRF